MFGRPNIEKLKKKRDIDRLVKALGHEDSDVRWEAAEALGEVGDARAVEPLIIALEEPVASWRKTKARGDVPSTDHDLVEPLMAEISRGSFVRHSAAEALGKLRDTRAVPSLIAALVDPDPGPMQVHHAAAEALTGFGEAAVPALTDALRDDDPEVRNVATGALAGFGPAAVEPLIAALGTDDPAVRKSAAGALGKLGDRRAVEPLIAALGQFPGAGQSKGSEPLISAAWALGEIGDERAVYPLIELFRNPAPYFSRAIRQGIGVMPSLRAWDDYPQTAAGHALRRIGQAALEPLIAALGDDDPDVRYMAAWVLPLLFDPSPSERRPGAAYPSEKESAPAVERLTQLALTDPDPHVRSLAEDSLLFLDTPQAKDARAKIERQRRPDQ